MAESIVVDGVGYTPEMVKNFVADSAALLEAHKPTKYDDRSVIVGVAGKSTEPKY